MTCRVDSTSIPLHPLVLHSQREPAFGIAHSGRQGIPDQWQTLTRPSPIIDPRLETSVGTKRGTDSLPGFSLCYGYRLPVSQLHRMIPPSFGIWRSALYLYRQSMRRIRRTHGMLTREPRQPTTNSVDFLQVPVRLTTPNMYLEIPQSRNRCMHVRHVQVQRLEAG